MVSGCQIHIFPRLKWLKPPCFAEIQGAKGIFMGRMAGVLAEASGSSNVIWFLKIDV
jgi:hypothetical protein